MCRQHFARVLLAASLAACAALAPAGAALAADSAATARAYANCTAIHRVSSGGIAKKGVTVDSTPSGSRPLKGTVKWDTALYRADQKSDRDGDGVACEKA